MKTAYKKLRAPGRITRPAQINGGAYATGGDLQPLSPQEQRMWDSLDRTPRPPGRPKIGRGAKNVLISLELGLLERADTFAKQHGVGRSQLIARAIERYLRDATEIESDLRPAP